jgi:hypothetical protein
VRRDEPPLPVVDQDVRVGVQRHALPRMAELRRQVCHRDTTRDLETRVAVPQIMRMEPRDPPFRTP